MTASLARLFEDVSRLSEEEQDRYAAVFRAELEDDARWDRTFEDTTDGLDEFGRRAVEAHRASKSTPFDLSKM